MRWVGTLLGVALGACMVVGCTAGTDDSSARHRSAGATATVTGAVVHGCRVTAVHTGAVPPDIPGFTGNGNPPWMGDRDFAAILWYARDARAVMRVGGRMAPGTNTKILWWVQDAGAEPLVIHGKEATTGRTFTQRVDGVGGGQYPSVPVVPAAGCWTLTETVGHRTAGAVTIAVRG